MRLFVLAIAALTVVGGRPPATEEAGTSPQPKRPLVILVHGRGQLGFDSAATRREWKRDLDSSLAMAGMPKLLDEDVRMAWYADVLDPESGIGCSNGAPDEAALGFGSFARGLLATLTSALPERETRATRGLMGDLLYLFDPWKRCAAERRIAQAVEAATDERRPVIVIAYSLGSLVTYSFLRSRPARASGTDLRLITLGSPLGVREIRELATGIVEVPELPAGVAAWINVYDADDPFSAPIAASGQTTRVEDLRTQSNSADDSHHIARYLRDRSTGAALAQSLCATAEDLIGTACSSVVTR